MIDLNVTLPGLIWQSDWNGDEVGWPDVPVVGLYKKQTGEEQEIYFYIDTENGRVLDVWAESE